MGLSGSLDELSLADLVDLTTYGGKTGRLTLREPSGAVIGTLDFRDGRLVDARCGDLQGEKAVYALVAIEEGLFEFDPEAEVAASDHPLAATSVLMEGMRRLDELQRLRAELPAPARVRLLSRDAAAADRLEARVLGYLGPGVRAIGDIVDGVLVGGDADEYDALMALRRLVDRGLVEVMLPPESADGVGRGGVPQPELER